MIYDLVLDEIVVNRKSKIGNCYHSILNLRKPQTGFKNCEEMWYAIGMVKQLTFVSCHASSLDDTCRGLVDYLVTGLGIPVHFQTEIDWVERYARLDRGQVDLAWICGAPYVRRMTSAQPNIALLAAPVWQGDRYGGRPVYFADVLVRTSSHFDTLADLQGARWVYNESGSLSGYAVLLAHLARSGHTPAFFGQIQASGAHLQSLRLLLAGQADLTCIDSIVWEEQLRQHPELHNELRVVERIGPLPSMPWVAATHLPVALQQQIRALLLDYGRDSAASARPGPLRNFVAIADGDYDPIRQVLSLADNCC